MGCDEFGLLLPSTHLPQAEIVIDKVPVNLQEATQQRNWPVTFRMGAVVCVVPPHSAEQIIDTADEFMHKVKSSTKNDVWFGTWDDKGYSDRISENQEGRPAE